MFSRFNDRKIVRVNSCSTCKYCLMINLDYNEPPYEEYFCLLGLSEEDRNFIKDEARDKTFRQGRLTGEDFSEKFRQLMMWNNPEKLPPDSERFVLCTNCCQYYNE